MILASELSLDAVLRRIVELAVEIADARYGALSVLTPDHRAIEEFITVGVTPEERAAIGEPPVGHGVLGLLIEEVEPLRMPDIGADPRSVGFPPNQPPMRSFLGAPVVARGTVFGNIYLTEKKDAPEFSDEDEAALIVLASQAGIAIENARLYEAIHRQQRELQRLSVLEDRERIAKELHDGVIQSLFAVGMGLQGAASFAKDDELGRRIDQRTPSGPSTDAREVGPLRARQDTTPHPSRFSASARRDRSPSSGLDQQDIHASKRDGTSGAAMMPMAPAPAGPSTLRTATRRRHTPGHVRSLLHRVAAPRRPGGAGDV